MVLSEMLGQPKGDKCVSGVRDELTLGCGRKSWRACLLGDCAIGSWKCLACPHETFRKQAGVPGKDWRRLPKKQCPGTTALK